MEYDSDLHACQKDALGKFGRVIDCVGWGESVKDGYLCPLDVQLLTTNLTDIEARALLGSPDLCVDADRAEVQAALDRAEEEAAHEADMLDGSPPRNMAKGKRRSKPLEKRLTPPALVALACRVLDDMVLDRDGRRSPTHVVAYRSSVELCFQSEDVFRKVAEIKAKAAEKAAEECAKTEDAEQKRSLLLDAEKYRSIFFGVVSSYQASRDTTAYLEAFRRAKLALIINVGIMKIGQDIPEIDAAVFIDPVNSLIDIVQMVGRTLRPFGVGKRAIVYLPVLESFGVVCVEDEDISSDHEAQVVANMTFEAK